MTTRVPRIKYNANAAGIAAIILLSNFMTASAAQVDTISDLQQKIRERNEEISKLEAEIVIYQSEVGKTVKEANTLQNTLKALDLSRKKLVADIGVTTSKISKANLELDQLSLAIQGKESDISENHEAIAESVRRINEADANNLVEIMLFAESISDFWNDIERQKQFQLGLTARLKILKNLKADLETNHKEVGLKKSQLESLQRQLSDQKKIIEINQKEKDGILRATKNKESAFRKTLEEKLALKEAFEEELLEFESKLQLEIDPTKLPKTGSGVLKWPLASVFVTQYFGNTTFAKTTNAYSGKGHNGIDLRAGTGTPILSAASGTVAGTGDTDTVCPGASYGKWVLITHENGLSTLYAHLSLIKVVPGQNIGTGELVGYSGNTGYSTGPHLHFTVYATQGVQILERKSRVCGGTYRMPVADLKAYINPLLYL